VTAAGDQPRSEFLRRSLWRVRTTPGRRSAAAAVTFFIILAVGVAIMWAAFAALGWLGAPGWVAALPWIVPTIGALVWALGRPKPAILSDDDDDSWAGYAVRLVMIGREEPRQRPARVLTAIVLGAPVAWALVLLLLLEMIGVL
jgi:hypothetical protein